MSKFFTSLLTVSLAFSGLTAYAVNENNPYAPTGDEEVIGKTQILYHGEAGNGNVLGDWQIGAPEGWSIECENREKSIDPEGKGNISIDGHSYKPMKFSNGAVHRVTLPSGYVANAVTIYSVSKIDAPNRPCYWAEVDGVTYEKPEYDYLDSYNDFDNPAVSYFTLAGNSNTFTLKNSGEQQAVVLVVDYTAPEGGETEEPAEVTYVVAHNIPGVANTGYEIMGTTKDDVNLTINGKSYTCLQLRNSWVFDNPDLEKNGCIVINPEDGLKKGDTITFTGCINSGDSSKSAGTKLSTAEGTTLHESGNMPDLKGDATDHETYTYTLTQDYPSLVLSRSGNTNTHISTLSVTRPVSGGTTAIENITTTVETETVIYDLYGRRVNNPSHGIFIINGKKVYVK